ncbi:hypothetical protein [Bremerella cremea]|uniref:hypothetical protein n=1 Tax=Bremerella cremea TaxID=1031537 RepID=UPI0031E7DD16
MSNRYDRQLISEWGRGLPVWLTSVSYITVKSVDSIFEITRAVRKEEGSLALPRNFSVEAWRALYLDHTADIKQVLLTLWPIGEEKFEEFVFKSNEEFQEDYAQWQGRIVERLGSLYADPVTRDQSINELCDEFAKVVYISDDRLTNIALIVIDRFFRAEVEDEEGLQWVESASLRFILEVLVPCMALYQELPSTLFQRAQEGDLDALEKLLELDQWVSMFPDWAAKTHSGDHSRDRDFLGLLATAITRERPKLEIAELKLTMASFISYLAVAVGTPIAHKKLRELFDLHAQIIGQGEIDKELTRHDDTFGRIIRRHREKWSRYTPQLPEELKRAMGRLRKQNSHKQRKAKRKRAA